MLRILGSPRGLRPRFRAKGPSPLECETPVEEGDPILAESLELTIAAHMLRFLPNRAGIDLISLLFFLDEIN